MIHALSETSHGRIFKVKKFFCKDTLIVQLLLPNPYLFVPEIKYIPILYTVNTVIAFSVVSSLPTRNIENVALPLKLY